MVLLHKTEPRDRQEDHDQEQQTGGGGSQAEVANGRRAGQEVPKEAPSGRITTYAAQNASSGFTPSR